MTTETEQKTGTDTQVQSAENADLTQMTDKDIKWRSKYKATVAEKEELQRKQERLEAERQELAQKIDNTMKIANERVIQAELKALAINEGIKDLDLLKLVDLSATKVDEKGEVVGLKEAISDFKSKKPDFFGTEKLKNSSTNAGNITEEKTVGVDAKKMSATEYAAAKRALLSGR